MTTEQQAMSDEERQKKLDEIKPYCLIIGFVKGEFDACVCLSETDFEKEKLKFELWKVHYFIKERTTTTPKVS